MDSLNAVGCKRISGVDEMQLKKNYSVIKEHNVDDMSNKIKKFRADLKELKTQVQAQYQRYLSLLSTTQASQTHSSTGCETCRIIIDFSKAANGNYTNYHQSSSGKEYDVKIRICKSNGMEYRLLGIPLDMDKLEEQFQDKAIDYEACNQYDLEC